MNATSPRPARRAAAPSEEDIIEIDAPTARSARRCAPRFSVSRRVVALSVAATLSAGALFAFAFGSRSGQTAEESTEVDTAIPAAARSAAAEGFGDRTDEVSRGSARSGLSEALAKENAKKRDEVLEDSADTAAKAETELSAAERERLMDEDMKLVEKQSAKLKKEAEEAAKRLAEAQKKAKNSKHVPPSEVKVSDEDVSNLTSSGGSMPVKSNYRIGAGWGATGKWSRYHTGQDFPAPTGTPIYAVASGVVLSSTAGGWAGTNVVIQHSNGSTLYAHMSSKAVSPGQTVKAGQLIGRVGNTGRSFGSHLHMEYYKPGVTPGKVYQSSNPMAFLRSLGVR